MGPQGGGSPPRPAGPGPGASAIAATDVAWFSRSAALAVGMVAAVEAVAFILGIFPRPAVPATLAATAAVLAVGWAAAASGRAWLAIWIDVAAFVVIAILGSAVFPLMFVTIVALPAATTVVTVPFLEGRRLWAMLAIVWAISIAGAAIGLAVWPPAGSDRVGTIAAVVSLVVIAVVASWQLVRVSRAFRRDRDAARASEARYRVLFEGSPVASLVFDPGTLRLLEVNPAAERMYGMDRATLLTMTLADLVAPALGGDLDALRDRLRAGDLVPLPAGWRHVRADGTLVDVSGASLLIPFEGRTARLLVILDVTEQRRLAEAASEAADGLEEAQAVAHVGSWSVTVGASGLESGALTWSAEALRILGLPPETGTVPGSAFYAIVHPDDFESLRDASRAAEARGAPFEVEHRIIRPDGQVRLVREHGTLVRDTDGRLLRHVGTIEDVTDRRELERRLAAAERLEAVGRLTSGIAHDFNNLITVISGNAELALVDLDPGSPARERVEAIADAARRSAAITGDLLTFTRRQRGHSRALRLADAVEAFAPACRDIAAPRVALVVRHDPEPVVVRIDRSGLGRILVNLVANARDAMPDGGTITISTGRRAGPDGHEAVIAVADTGIGMSADVMTRAFEPFYSTKRDTGPAAMDGPRGGSGLGLAIVAGLVDEAGGRVELESELGLGTTVRVLLPVAGSAEAGGSGREEAAGSTVHQGAAASPVEGTGTRVGASILLVEDDPEVATFVTAALAAAGHRVTGAASADDAWATHLVRTGPAGAEAPPPVDLVVSDVVMPGMSGTELARRLAARQPRIPVVLMSAYAAEVEGLVDAAGPVTLLDKPFTVGELLDAVDRSLRA